jgi:hypothetical protein
MSVVTLEITYQKRSLAFVVVIVYYSEKCLPHHLLHLQTRITKKLSLIKPSIFCRGVSNYIRNNISKKIVETRRGYYILLRKMPSSPSSSSSNSNCKKVSLIKPSIFCREVSSYIRNNISKKIVGIRSGYCILFRKMPSSPSSSSSNSNYKKLSLIKPSIFCRGVSNYIRNNI